MIESSSVCSELLSQCKQPSNTTSSILSSQIKAQVREFWENSPCDSWFTTDPCGTPAFYRSLDEHRYKVHRRLQLAVSFELTRGLRVLEIGCGCGSEAERFARSGARYTALDLTQAALTVTRKRFQLASLEGRFVQGDAESLPFRDCSFEFVYSHGVLHHTPDTPRTIGEIHRVLSPGGRAVVMLYYRDSFNYHINLGIVRRLRARLLRTERGIKLACALFDESEKNLRRQAELIRLDPHSYLEPQNLLNRNTDGPDNPLSQVFSKKSAECMFSQFKDVRTTVMFWNPHWLPGIGKLLPLIVEDWLASHWGWHLWIYAQKSPIDSIGPKEIPHSEQRPVRRVLVYTKSWSAVLNARNSPIPRPASKINGAIVAGVAPGKLSSGREHNEHPGFIHIATQPWDPLARRVEPETNRPGIRS